MHTRRLVFTLGALALCCSAELAHCQPSPSESPAAAEQVLKIDEARRVAMLHNDVAALERLFADDLTIFWGDGSTDTKSSALAALRSHALSSASSTKGRASASTVQRQLSLVAGLSAIALQTTLPTHRPTSHECTCSNKANGGSS